MYNPAFIFVIGGAFCNRPLDDDQPQKPPWLSEAGVGWTSALSRCTNGLKDMPEWKEKEVRLNKDLPFLGQAKQKKANMTWWRPFIHQLLLYVGTSRTGKGAKLKKSLKTRGIQEIKGPVPVPALPSPESPQLRRGPSVDYSPTEARGGPQEVKWVRWDTRGGSKDASGVFVETAVAV